MWIILAFASAFFAGIVSILAKCGIKNTDSTVATAIRTVVVLIMSFVMVLLTDKVSSFENIGIKSWLFLSCSGIATGASWLCYFKALQTGDVSKVVPIDKSSTVLTSVLSFIILSENVSTVKWICLMLILAGTLLMTVKKKSAGHYDNKYLIFAVLSAIFASLTSILAKIGIQDVPSNTANFIRTAVVLVMAWMMVFVTNKANNCLKISKKELAFLVLSGLATGASWLCFFRAIQTGNVSAVVPIDKLSILVTVAFSAIVFKEKMNKKEFTGLALIVAGTLGMLI